jgi:ABC-2 type transport system permease protein
MTLLSVERIKLFSTRSPYWCLASILAAALLFALLMGTIEGGRQATTYLSQTGLQIGMIVFMVLAALAVTTEYRFGTIRVSFLAVPRRPNVLLATTVLLVVLAAIAALVCSFAAFFLTKALANPEVPLTLSSGDDWRMVVGHTALFALAAVIAVAVGTLIRQSAGAITILLVWPLLLENLVQLIPKVGRDIHNWMPFTAAANFVSPGPNAQVFGQALQAGGPTAVQGLLVFAATAVVLWAAALLVLLRRDA